MLKAIINIENKNVSKILQVGKERENMFWAAGWMFYRGTMSRKEILKFLDETYLSWEKGRFGVDSAKYKRERDRIYKMNYFQLVEFLDRVVKDIYKPKTYNNILK